MILWLLSLKTIVSLLGILGILGVWLKGTLVEIAFGWPYERCQGGSQPSLGMVKSLRVLQVWEQLPRKLLLPSVVPESSLLCMDGHHWQTSWWKSSISENLRLVTVWRKLERPWNILGHVGKILDRTFPKFKSPSTNACVMGWTLSLSNVLCWSLRPQDLRMWLDLEKGSLKRWLS